MTIKISDFTAPTMGSSDTSLTFKAQWYFWKSLLKDSWNHIDVWWEYYQPGHKEVGKKPWDLKHYGLSGSSTSDSCEFLRNDPRANWKIYPIGPWKIGRVNCWVKGKSDKDVDQSGWYYSQDLVIRTPPGPKVEIEVEHSSEGTGDSGVSDLKISVEKGEWPLPHMNAETDIYDTMMRIVKTSNTSPTEVLRNWAPYLSHIDTHLDVSNIAQGLAYDEWVKVDVEAYSRGCAGDGAHCTASHVFCWPAIPQITKVAVDTEHDVVLIGVETNWSEYHRIDTVKLQRLKDSDCETASAAAQASGWSDVPGMTDTNDCKGLSDNLVDARPAKGKRTWYRIVAQHDDYTTYSVPADLGIYQPAVEAQAGAASILSAMSGDDGESAIVDVGWDDDTFLNVTDPSEIANYKGSTQVTWADTEYAWRSTASVSEFEIDWEDDEPQSEEFAHSARVYVSDLTEGEPIFLRVRRVLTSDEETVYGAWSEIVAVTPASAPSWVELSAPSYIARGESLPLTWTFGSEAAQTGWALIDTNGKLWGKGDDASGYYIIESDSLQDVSEISLYVNVTTGGEWKRSVAPVTVRIVEAPTCEITVDEVVAALPIKVTGVTNGDAIAYYLVSRGVTYESPHGVEVQYANDIVWTGKGLPGELEIDDAALMNGCTYELRAHSSDETTGLCSETVSKTLKVDWVRRAPVPDATIEVNEDTLEATITTVKTDEMADGDTYELYRLTKDGAYLVAEGAEPGSVIIDRFAPYSAETNAYRVAVRTPDGDVAWVDVEYEMEHTAIRLDWERSFVELPYNIEIAEALAKSFESREHLDGAINGYWNKAIAHQAKINTDIIRLDSYEQQRLIRELARYSGAVFVRTGSGLAFDANVDVDEIAESYDSGSIGVSLSIEEVELTDAHAVQMGDIVTLESEGEDG